jgi:uncharacterized protein (TIGR00369 family)
MGGEEPPAPVARLIGFELTEADIDHAVVELETRPEHFNVSGAVHGGILCDIADAAMGLAYATQVEEGMAFVTVELKINFLRPVWQTRLRAIGSVVHRGRTIGMTECEIMDDRDRLMAKASSTLMTIRDERADGRRLKGQ